MKGSLPAGNDQTAVDVMEAAIVLPLSGRQVPAAATVTIGASLSVKSVKT